MIDQISSLHAFHSEWEVAGAHEQEALALKILDQPFSYLGKGRQAYAFVSQDGQYVLKLFRDNRVRAASLFAFFAPDQVERKNLKRHDNLCQEFASYKIAFEELREETGNIYLHLNKTRHLKTSVSIEDRSGKVHCLDLDEMEFVVQHKVQLIEERLSFLVKRGDLEAAKSAIDSMLYLVRDYANKDIGLKSTRIAQNFGFLGSRAVQLDCGSFEKGVSPIDGLTHDAENFALVLDKISLELGAHFRNHALWHQLEGPL